MEEKDGAGNPLSSPIIIFGWFGSVIGSALFIFGAFWFLAILGYSVPWYAVFPVLAMFVGGFFITAALATRKDLNRKVR